MKRGILAAGLLAAMVGLSLWHIATVGDLTREVRETLAQAEARAEAGSWEEAAALTREAEDIWRAKDFYVHVTLQHEVTDEVLRGFGEVREFIQARESGEYSAANARLMEHLYLLGEAERLTLENLL